MSRAAHPAFHYLLRCEITQCCIFSASGKSGAGIRNGGVIFSSIGTGMGEGNLQFACPGICCGRKIRAESKGGKSGLGPFAVYQRQKPVLEG